MLDAEYSLMHGKAASTRSEKHNKIMMSLLLNARSFMAIVPNAIKAYMGTKSTTESDAGFLNRAYLHSTDLAFGINRTNMHREFLLLEALQSLSEPCSPL
jgi:hypothetical protein